MSKQAQVGLFTLLGIVALFAVFFVLSNFGLRADSYQIGVRFASASGVRPGADVYLSGVPVGTVDRITLLESYKAEVVMSIKGAYDIPSDAQFIIQAPLTGEPSVLIQPPRHGAAGAGTLPHEILPLAQQPQGANPATVADLLAEGQGQIKRVGDMLAQLQEREPVLLSQLSSTLRNANDLTKNANASLSRVSDKIERLTDAVQGNMTSASQNVADLTGSLDQTVKRNSKTVDELLAQLQQTSKSFGETVDSLHDVATNPQVKRNLVDTANDLAASAKSLAGMTADLRRVTSNAQTQSQLRDTVAQIDATTQKVNSLLGQIGGTSHVYGVDRGATPPPNATPGASAPPSSISNAPGTSAGTTVDANVNGGPGSVSAVSAAPTTDAGSSARLASLRSRIDAFTKDLVELQVRVGQLAPYRPGSAGFNTSPVTTPDRGPQGDFNLFVLPKASTGLEFGVNDLGVNEGQTTTANVLLVKRSGNVSYATGILYSNLGVDTTIAGRAFGVEARAYDLRHPTLDTYLNLPLQKKLQLFGGERDVIRATRRTVFGVQAEF